MKNDCIEISRNDRKESLPDVAYNSAEDSFFVFWAAAPGEESQTADFFISGQYPEIGSVGACYQRRLIRRIQIEYNISPIKRAKK